ncbi:predicted protein [Postia placenta Mad-698-R]|nr:predicted protein [Postia placenta Mad-698-R]
MAAGEDIIGVGGDGGRCRGGGGCGGPPLVELREERVLERPLSGVGGEGARESSVGGSHDSLRAIWDVDVDEVLRVECVNLALTGNHDGWGEDGEGAHHPTYRKGRGNKGRLCALVRAQLVRAQHADAAPGAGASERLYEGGVEYVYSDDVYGDDLLMVMEEHVDDDEWKQTLTRWMEENIDKMGGREH